MREFLQGRRLGFALRPLVGQIAIGFGIAVTLLDLMAWFGWGARDTNGFVIAAYWLALAAAIAGFLATLTALVETLDIADEDRTLGRLDLAAAFVATLLYVGTAALRAGDLGAAGASPAALLSAFAGLVLLGVTAVIASTLYATREWTVIEEEYEPRRHPRRRRAG